MANMKFFVSFVVIIASFQRTHGVEYSVTNRAATTPGGIQFTNEIGDEYSRQTLISATDFIWQIFQQTSETDRKNVTQVSLIIETMDGAAYTGNNEIHISEGYIGRYSGDVKTEITGVLYHEMTHVWQWDGRGPNQTLVPVGLIEGIADFVRLKANYAPTQWVQPGQGDRWDKGYDVTARFLDYCDSVRSGFVAELNRKSRSGYSDNYFVDLTGKTVDQLWSDYKGDKPKYNTNYEIVCFIE